MNIHIGLLADFPAATTTIILIGNRSCDHLRELIRMIEFRGRAAYRIENAAELQPRWFAGVEEVGIVVGAENLQPVVHDVLTRLDDFSAAAQRGMLEGVAQ
jgi:4-hydroxy-3-methylbut-2-enyl diphosphate reductase